MALSKLDSLYMAVVADHSKNPHHQGKLEDAEQISLNNPTCGDVINLSVKFNEEDCLEDIAFLNSGCTISTASASMMTDAVLGKTKQEILGSFTQVLHFIYDEQGRLVKSFEEGDNVFTEYHYRNNPDDTLTVIQTLKMEGSPKRIISENTYDKNGLLLVEKTEDESCEEGCEKLENGMNKYSHHYDEHGNILETRNEIFGGEPFKYVNKYVDGKLVEQTQFAYGGREVTTFDTNGNKIKFEDFPPYGFGDGSVSSVKIWKNTLDNYGNVVRIEEFDNRNNPSSTIVENSYEYY